MKKYPLEAFEVAELLGYNVQHIRKLAAKGDLPAVKRRRQWFFNKEDVLAVYEPNTEVAHENVGQR